MGGAGDTARRFDCFLVEDASGGLSRLSVDDRFIDEKGDLVLTLPFGELMPALSLSRAAAAGFGAPAAA